MTPKSQRETISWHIGQSAHGKERLDSDLLKACFYWKRDGVIVESAEYSLGELNRFIAELGDNDPYRPDYDAARTQLERNMRLKGRS